ncbi:hypothetical protein [Dongia soli]|uniref:hypothetical protein n=1 Tax=Dongia soli TaxID=600628 RepID=UPI0036D3F49B
MTDWTGGTGEKPATGKYVGANGLVGAIADAIDIRGAAGEDGEGEDGTNGWSPVLAMVADGARRVQQVTDWTGGTGDKPAAGKYVGAGGLVDAIADAVDIRGATGDPGDPGQPGADGADGSDGDDGWSPVFAVVADGDRRVQQVTDWAGGSGAKPAVGKFVGAAGLVDAIADAVDIRGAAGADGAPAPRSFQAPVRAGGIYCTPTTYGGFADQSYWDMLILQPIWFSETQKISAIGVGVDPNGTQPGRKARLGIYASGPDNRCGGLLLDAGEADLSSGGFASIDIDYEMIGGTIYWLGAVINAPEADDWLYLYQADALGGEINWILGLSSANEFFNGIPNGCDCSFGPLPPTVTLDNVLGGPCVFVRVQSQ